MAELKKSVVTKTEAEAKKEEVKAAPAAKKEETKAAPAKKAPAKKAAAPKVAEAKKVAPAKKEEAPKAAAKKETAKKSAPAKKETAKKAPAKKAAVKETLAVQFSGKDYQAEDIIKLAKDAYKATKNKAAIKTINVYVNTDDSKAYYVVNDEFHGSVEI